ncbi:MAG TPA: hypothetical protein VGF19_10810, partial [Candidatus Acidoferrum sp.]
MKTEARRFILVCGALVIGLSIVALASPAYRLCVALAIGDYLRPTEVVEIPLNVTCVSSIEQPSPRATTIIESQAKLYHLVLQSVAVCRTPQRMSQAEQEFAQAFFSADTRAHWLPTYLGCCTYSFRRHFAIVVAEDSSEGTLVVRASLMQSRWEYLK